MSGHFWYTHLWVASLPPSSLLIPPWQTPCLPQLSKLLCAFNKREYLDPIQNAKESELDVFPGEHFKAHWQQWVDALLGLPPEPDSGGQGPEHRPTDDKADDNADDAEDPSWHERPAGHT